MAAQAQGKHTPAIGAFRTSLQIFTELGARWDMARLLSEMGRSTFALGNDSEAEHLWHESLRLSMETHGMITTMEAIVGVASMQAKRGNNHYALKLLLTSINHPATMQETKDRAEELVAELKEKLTSEKMKSAQTFAEGSTIEAVVVEVLGQTKNEQDQNNTLHK